MEASATRTARASRRGRNAPGEAGLADRSWLLNGWDVASDERPASLRVGRGPGGGGMPASAGEQGVKVSFARQGAPGRDGKDGPS